MVDDDEIGMLKSEATHLARFQSCFLHFSVTSVPLCFNPLPQICLFGCGQVLSASFPRISSFFFAKNAMRSGNNPVPE